MITSLFRRVLPFLYTPIPCCEECGREVGHGHTMSCTKNPNGHFIKRVSELPHKCRPPGASFGVSLVPVYPGSLWQRACSDVWLLTEYGWELAEPPSSRE